jgi:hypothetical protein
MLNICSVFEGKVKKGDKIERPGQALRMWGEGANSMIGKWFKVLAFIMMILVPGAAVEAQEGALELTNTTTFLGMTVSYPADWLMGGYEDAILLGNREEMIDVRFTDEFPSGSVQIFPFLLRIGKVFPRYGLDHTASPLDYLKADSMYQQEIMQLPYRYGEPEAMTVGGKSGARLFIGNDLYDTHVFAIQYAPWLILVLHVKAAIGELARWEATALAIAESITYDDMAAALELTETYTSDDERLTVRYPTGWLTSGFGYDIYFANRRDALVHSSDFAPGVAQIFVVVDTVDNTAALTGLNIQADDTPLKILEALIKDRLTAEGEPPFTVMDSPTAFELGTRLAATMTFTGEEVEGQVWLIQILPDWIAQVQLRTAPGELDLWQATALAVAESITFSDLSRDDS